MNAQPPNLHTTTVGDADAPHRIVFLHGLFGRGRNFTSIAKALEPEAHSLLVDLPNHGRSGWVDEVSYEQMADSVAAELRRSFADRGPVDVVGHSMGGKTAMVLALRHPDLVRRLVVLDISPTAARSGSGEFQHLLDALASLDVDTLASRTQADELLHPRIPVAATRMFLLQNLTRSERGFRWEPNLSVLRAQLDRVTGFPDVAGLQYPGRVLWIGGSESTYITDADEPPMRALFPDTKRLTIEGAGHWVHAEQPAETIAALRDFLFT